MTDYASTKTREIVDKVESDLETERIDRVKLALQAPGYDLTALPELKFAEGQFEVPPEFKDHFQCEIRIDGGFVKSIFLAPTMPEPALAEYLAEAVQDVVGHDLQATWPQCPIHRDHPLRAAERNHQAVWVCARTGSTVAPIGQLARLSIHGDGRQLPDADA
ncbi:MAG: hypothetical protein M3540_06175 [Actinomycetota bacterium]|nr:hypothetical protein [Actinomycetota bacterium]